MLSPGTKKAKERDLPTNINPLLLAIPASCDFMGSSLMMISLTMVPASVYQMMRGFIVVITALFSIVFLKRRLYRHHLLGVILIVLGVGEVGYVAIAAGGDDDTQGSVGLGILLLIVSQCFAGTQFVTEEKLLSGYYLDPFKVVGTEGMWGLSYYLFLLPIFQYITCPTTGKGLAALCFVGRLEDSAFAFKQIKSNWVIALEYLGIICSISLFNVFGISTTKYASSAQRSTIDTSRTVLIWGCSIWFLGEDFQPWAIAGFVLLVAGTLIYNEIVELPFMDFNTNTKRAIKEREDPFNADDDIGYMATSPHAAYDQSRNRRSIANNLEKEVGLLKEDKDDYMLNT